MYNFNSVNWVCYLPELDLVLTLILVILYGLYALTNKHLHINEIQFFCRLVPLIVCINSYIDGASNYNTVNSDVMQITSVFQWVYPNSQYSLISIDLMLSLLIFAIMPAFKSLESILFLMFAYIGQFFMLHSVNLISFYINLELQNFCFLILCGLLTSSNNAYSASGRSSNSVKASVNSAAFLSDAKRPVGFNVEAALKYLVYSAFSSGVLLFWFSMIYLKTGTSLLFFNHLTPANGILTSDVNGEVFLILIAIMFKLGAAPLHFWMIDIYNGVKRPLVLYVGTAPKLSLFGFWINNWHPVWTDFSIAIFVVFSIVLGSFGAYAQPALRSLLAYSTVNEIGIMLMALESAGFHTLMQHLLIYIVTQIVLWNLTDKRLFAFLAVTLAGLPPLAGFFGKAWIFWHAANMLNITLLVISLFCTGVALVYYLRLLRLFWYVTSPYKVHNNSINGVNKWANNATISIQWQNGPVIGLGSLYTLATNQRGSSVGLYLVSACVISLAFMPFYIVKPFVL